MDDIFGLFWAIIVIAVAVSSSNKKKAKKQQTQIPYETVSVDSSPYSEAPHTTPAPVKVRTRPAPAATMAAPLERQELKKVIEPTVHAHTAPDCVTHDAPGSLGVASPEGKDPCHAAQLPDPLQPRPAYAVASEIPGLSLEWSGENMVKAVIMQEVLTRPCQRRKY